MQKTPVLTITQVATAAIAANLFVGFDGAAAGAAEKALGVAAYPANAAGDALAIDVLGTTKILCAGVIAIGGPIKSDANGKAVAQGGAGEILGYALETGAADKIIEMLLTP